MSGAEQGDEDAADVRRVLDGDVAAFGGIVQRWHVRLFSLAWRFCRDRSMAEDMTQEAFVRAFRALDTFRGDAAFSTWLTAVALNSYRNALRNRPPPLIDLEGIRLGSAEAGPLAKLIAGEQAEAVRHMVATLPDLYRDPIVLYYFKEMNLAEAAEILHVPEGTLKARLHRGKEFLKRRFAAAGILHGARTDNDA